MTNEKKDYKIIAQGLVQNLKSKRRSILVSWAESQSSPEEAGQLIAELNAMIDAAERLAEEETTHAANFMVTA